jgi:xanthine dehydrogenase small subunit
MTTLLDWLREHRGLKGTKEGCAEGDCGACTVVLERADGRHEAINSCIAMLGQMDGQAIRTVEGLLGKDGAAASGAARDGRVGRHAMRLLHAGLRDVGLRLCRGGEPPSSRPSTMRWPATLCRCTGYRPIVEAMKKVAGIAASRGCCRRAHGARPCSAASSSRRARSTSSCACAPGIPSAAAGRRHRSRPAGQPRAHAAPGRDPCRARAGART